MKAIVYDRYGPADVLRMAVLPTPQPGKAEVLVRVTASSVTTADWRLRAAAFPGVLAVPGRLMFGLTGPRNKVLGGVFAGQVQEVRDDVTAFRPGDRVFGVSGGGAHAEYLTISQDATIIHTPDRVSDAEAAALPFGALSALVFLRDFAKLKPGQSVLIVGASGGVGSYAVQIAKRMGAQVTGVASAVNHPLLTELGADKVVDYHLTDFTKANSAYDVVFDTVGATDFRRIRNALKPEGLFIPLNFGMREVWQALWSGMRGGKRIRIGVSGDTRPDLEQLVAWLKDGTLRPVVDSIHPMDNAREAHRAVETRHSRGTVVLQIAEPMSGTVSGAA